MIGNIKLGIVLPTWLTRMCPANHSCGADDVNVELYYLFSSADIFGDVSLWSLFLGLFGAGIKYNHDPKLCYSASKLGIG